MNHQEMNMPTTKPSSGKMGRKRGKRIMTVILVILSLLILQTLPRFFPKPLFAKTLNTGDIRVNYVKGDEKGAEEVLNLLTERGDEIRRQLNAPGQTRVEVHLYPTQWQLAIREAGFATLLVAPEWHIGDSHGGNIMMVSPYTPVRVHTHDSILAATLHEWVHAVNHEMNPDLNYFWDNGLATYLAGQVPDEAALRSMQIPSIADMHTENGIKFGEMGGYAFSYDYIRFLEKKWGWEAISKYAKGDSDYASAFGMNEEELYDLWKASLTN